MVDSACREALYKEFHPKVLGYMKARIQNHSDAEDLAANVFLKVFQKLSSFDSEKASVSTWIYTITRNTLTDYFRTRRVFSPLEETEIAPGAVEDGLLHEERLELLASALEQMEDRQRDLVILHYYENKPLTEIAERMKISYSYVKILHKKAMEALKKSLR